MWDSWYFICCPLEPLAHRRNVVSLGFFYRYYFGRCSSEQAQLVPILYSRGRSTRYSDRSHDFYVTILWCYKDVYANSFFPLCQKNSLSIECFPLTYDLNAFKSRINRHQTPFNCRFFLNRFLVCFNLFVFLFLVSTCPVERGHFLHSIYEWIEFYILIKTSSGNFLRLSSSWVQMRGISIDQNHNKVCRCWPPGSKIVHGSTHIVGKI